MIQPEPPQATPARKASEIAFDAARRAQACADELAGKQDIAAAAASEARRCAELCVQKERAGETETANDLARRALAEAKKAADAASVYPIVSGDVRP